MLVDADRALRNLLRISSQKIKIAWIVPEPASHSKEHRERLPTGGTMCPVCVASTAVMVAGAGSAGGILALCIARFKKSLLVTGLALFQKSGLILSQKKEENRYGTR
jgi:hypothetical protein